MRRGLNLKFTPQYISDVLLIEPTFQGDSRGYFVEIIRKDLFEEFLGYQVNFVQEKAACEVESEYIISVIHDLIRCKD